MVFFSFKSAQHHMCGMEKNVVVGAIAKEDVNSFISTNNAVYINNVLFSESFTEDLHTFRHCPNYLELARDSYILRLAHGNSHELFYFPMNQLITGY